MPDDELFQTISYLRDKIAHDRSMYTMKTHFVPDPFPLVSEDQIVSGIVESTDELEQLIQEMERRFIP